MHNPSSGELNQSRSNILMKKSQEGKLKPDLGPYFQAEDQSRQMGVPQSLLTNSNKITFRNLEEPPTLAKQGPKVVVESPSPTPQGTEDLSNFNAFTGKHLAAANSRPIRQGKKGDDSDDEFARGDSIPISETLR